MFRAAPWSMGFLAALAGCDLVFGLPAPETADGGTNDGGIVDSTRDGPMDLQIIARYRFDTDGPAITDDVGDHHGMAMGGVRSTPGQVGSAIEFPAAMPVPHVVVPDSADWDLAEGAIELWVRAAPGTEQLGIMSRDSFGTDDGHYTLIQHGGQFFAARLQVANQSDRYLCSEQAPVPGTWMHLVINFGPPSTELWVDGIRGTHTKPFTFGMSSATCNNAGTRAIHGNNNPWVFGALGWSSQPGTASTIVMPFVNGAIDELIVWRSRRDLTTQRRRPPQHADERGSSLIDVRCGSGCERNSNVADRQPETNFGSDAARTRAGSAR